jgi:hypothetical protein
MQNRAGKRRPKHQLGKGASESGTSQHNEQMKAIIAVIMVGLVLALGFAAWLSHYYLWPPDVASGRRKTLSNLVTKQGDRIELVQLWNGDGYLTQLRQTEPDGAQWDVVINPDGRKSWKGLIIETTNNTVLLVKVWDHNFLYDRESKKFFGTNGKLIDEGLKMPMR